MISRTYPDILLILSNDIIVLDMLYSSGFEDILLDVSYFQSRQPIEFLLVPKLAAFIRDEIERTENQIQKQNFDFVSSNDTVYEIRLIYEQLDEKSNVVCLIRDVSDLVESRKNLEYMVSHDTLTSLPNRSSYYKTLSKTIEICQQSNKLCGILFFDLDHFKTINDSLGHRIGDELLVSISNRLRNNLKNNEFIARISGDEFIIIVKEVIDESEIIETAKRVLSIFKQAFQLENQIIDVKASIGVSIFPKHSHDPDLLTQYADTAMYQAKDLGGNQISLFDKRQNSQVKRNFQVDQDLRRAIKNDELFMVYQPQFCLKTGDIICLESLARWQMKSKGLISPSKFIPIAEITGYINELGLWIINNVCSQINDWKQKKIDFKKIAINLSRNQLIDPDLVDSIFSIMKYHGVEGFEIIFEITEESFIKNNNQAFSNLIRLNQAGINLAIDDFGSGYSSFVDLKNFPFSELKIDKSIIDDIGVNNDNDAIILAIIALGKELGLEIVAEGVETKTQFDFLKKNNCHKIQGFYLGKPLSVSEVENIL